MFDVSASIGDPATVLALLLLLLSADVVGIDLNNFSPHATAPPPTREQQLLTSPSFDPEISGESECAHRTKTVIMQINQVRITAFGEQTWAGTHITGRRLGIYH